MAVDRSDRTGRREASGFTEDHNDRNAPSKRRFVRENAAISAVSLPHFPIRPIVTRWRDAGAYDVCGSTIEA